LRRPGAAFRFVRTLERRRALTTDVLAAPQTVPVVRRQRKAAILTIRTTPAGDLRDGMRAANGSERTGFAWSRSRQGPETIMTSLMQRKARPIQHGAPARLFGIGQAVRLKGSFGTLAKTTEVYHVTGTLPPKENSPQYRIRSDAEPHERVVTEDRLEPAGTLVSDAGLMLIERTFGHGQGTETLQPRDQETEAGEGSGQA